MSITKKTSSIVCLITACVFALLGTALAQAQAAAAANPNPELVGQLTQQLGVTKAQATGGAGAIFGLAKSKLSPENFSKLSAAVPGMGGFLKAAPAAGQAGQAGQAGSSPMGSLGSMMPGKAGGLASLAGSFNSLGMSPSMVTKFAPVLQNYVGAKGGASTASLLSGVLK
jgi:Protein of unknown function VcgC/VcgE (DUF2780)